MAQRGQGPPQLGEILRDLALQTVSGVVIVADLAQFPFGGAGQCQGRVDGPGRATVRLRERWQGHGEQTGSRKALKLRDRHRTQLGAALVRHLGRPCLRLSNGAGLTGMLAGLDSLAQCPLLDLHLLLGHDDLALQGFDFEPDGVAQGGPSRTGLLGLMLQQAPLGPTLGVILVGACQQGLLTLVLRVNQADGVKRMHQRIMCTHELLKRRVQGIQNVSTDRQAQIGRIIV